MKQIALPAIGYAEFGSQTHDRHVMKSPAELRYDVDTGSGRLPLRGSLWSGVLPLAGFAEPDQDYEPEPPPAVSAARSEVELAAAAEAFVGMSMTDIERHVIEATIRACSGSLPRAARMLGLSPSTLYRKRARWVEGPQASPTATRA